MWRDRQKIILDNKWLRQAWKKKTKKTNIWLQTCIWILFPSLLPNCSCVPCFININFFSVFIYKKLVNVEFHLIRPLGDDLKTFEHCSLSATPRQIRNGILTAQLRVFRICCLNTNLKGLLCCVKNYRIVIWCLKLFILVKLGISRVTFKCSCLL